MNASITEQLLFFLAGAFTAIELVGVMTENLAAAWTGAAGFGACAAVGVAAVIRHYMRRPADGEPR